MINRILILSFMLFLSASPLMAGDFYFDATALGQIRQDKNLAREIPVNGYLGLGGKSGDGKFSGAANMRQFREIEQGLDDYDLYQAVFHYRPVEALRIDSGRQFVNQGFSVEMMDGLQATLGPWQKVGVAFYSGIPRSVELGDFNKNDGLLSGAAIQLKNVARTDASIRTMWRKNDIHLSDRRNDELLVGGNFSHQFAIAMTPMGYSVVEYDPVGKLLTTGTAGFDIYPKRWWALNTEFQYSDIRRDTDRRTIQGTFTDGQTIGGRFSSTWTIVRHWLDLGGSYTYRRLKVARDFRNGQMVDGFVTFNIEKIGFKMEPGVSFEKSYGGDVRGGRIAVSEQFTEKLFTEGGFDYVQYQKVTNNNDNAFATVGAVGYEVAKGWTLSGGFEYNKNNMFNKDVRGTLRLDCHL